MIALLAICYQLAAGQADYDGKTLTLTGQFEITHPMGRLSAEKATLRNPQLHRPAKKATQLYLENDVAIHVPEGKNPFSIFAKRALCDLLPNTVFSLFQFQEIQFFDQVEIRTLGDLVARGGSALYKLGALILFPSLPTTHCQLLRGADRIDAREIRFELPTETLTCDAPEGSLQQDAYRFSASQLVWRRKERTLQLQNKVQLSQPGIFTLEGDEGLICCREEFEPETLLLQGSVRLIAAQIQEKESYAAADTLLYRPLEKTLVLSARAPRKVLFWQDGLSLSASEIQIRQDAATKKETIEGIGDVHFAFDIDEQNYFEKLFSNYL